MHFSFALLSAVALFGSALASPAPAAKPGHPAPPVPGPPKPSTQCFTAMKTGLLLQFPHTTYQTWTTSCLGVATTSTVTSTSTPQTTTTLTTTITSTSTAPTSTYTATSYTTVTVTSTSTAPVSTATSIVSTTLSTATTYTVATSTGFIPVRSSLPDSNLYKKSLRPMAAPKTPNLNIAIGKLTGLRALIAKLLPGDVTCHLYKPAPCTTSTATQTITATASTVTLSTTSTSTNVVTTYPVANTTVVSTQTQTSVVTTTPSTTVTSTTTFTQYTGTSTYYAGCAPTNMANSLQGQPIDNLSLDQDGMTSTDDQDTYNCCVSALTNPFGSSWAMADNFGCIVLTRNTCAANSNDQSEQKGVYTGEDFPQVTVGNGYCGQFSNYYYSS